MCYLLVQGTTEESGSYKITPTTCLYKDHPSNTVRDEDENPGVALALGESRPTQDSTPTPGSFDAGKFAADLAVSAEETERLMLTNASLDTLRVTSKLSWTKRRRLR